jgi:hypothetical protein
MLFVLGKGIAIDTLKIRHTWPFGMVGDDGFEPPTLSV